MYYNKWEGADTAPAAARGIVVTHALPEDLTLTRLGGNTPGHQVASLAELALTCGVLPVCGEILWRQLKPSICLVALDCNSKVVSCPP
jgi:hypothetical protein